jgi:hypothetical protein
MAFQKRALSNEDTALLFLGQADTWWARWISRHSDVLIQVLLECRGDCHDCRNAP